MKSTKPVTAIILHNLENDHMIHWEVPFLYADVIKWNVWLANSQYTGGHIINIVIKSTRIFTFLTFIRKTVMSKASRS